MSLELLHDLGEEAIKKLLKQAADLAGELSADSAAVTSSTAPEAAAPLVDVSYTPDAGTDTTPGSEVVDDPRVEALRADIARDLNIPNTESVQIDFDASGQPEIRIVDRNGSTIAKIIPIESLDNGTERWFLNNVDADRRYIISTLEGDATPYATARELMRLGFVQKDDIIYFNDHLNDDQKGFCYRNNQLLVINFDGTWTCNGPDCPPEITPEPEREPEPAAPVVEKISEPDIVAEDPAPEVVPEPVTESFTDSRQKLWLAVCPDGGYTCREALKMNVLRETHILEAAQSVSDSTLAERLEETRRVLLNDPTYQTGITNKFFIFVDDDGSLKCVYLRTGEIDTYDPNANARANGVVHKVGAGDGRSYLIGTLETERGGGIRTSESDLYFPGEPLRMAAVDGDGDGDIDRFEPVPRSVEETQMLNRAVVGEDVFGDRGGLGNPANQEKWNWVLAQQLPEGFFEASPKEQISMLMKSYGLTRDQANDLMWYLKTVMTGPMVEEVQARLGVDRKFAEMIIHYFYSYNSQGMPSPDADEVYRTFGKYGVSREQAQDIANYMRTEELSPKRSGTREIPFGKLGYTKAFAADGTPKTLGQIFDDAAREAKQRGNIY